jgi:hypothetical protein
MAQIDIEYAGRTYTVPWTDDNVERLKGIAQHVRDGRAEVFTVLGDGFALTIVIGPTIPLTITYVDGPRQRIWIFTPCRWGRLDRPRRQISSVLLVSRV